VENICGNRVATIQEFTADASWHHVSSASNPADLISRGCNPQAVSANSLWWKGPHWLVQATSTWPISPVSEQADIPDMKQVHVSTILSSDDITQKYSKLSRLVRVIACCKRFAFNTRQKEVNRLTSPLSVQELDTALFCCVKLVQHNCYKQELQD
jgi:hypothetical protein